jgi:hypothetical protein
LPTVEFPSSRSFSSFVLRSPRLLAIAQQCKIGQATGGPRPTVPFCRPGSGRRYQLRSACQLQPQHEPAQPPPPSSRETAVAIGCDQSGGCVGYSLTHGLGLTLALLSGGLRVCGRTSLRRATTAQQQAASGGFCNLPSLLRWLAFDA